MKRAGVSSRELQRRVEEDLQACDDRGRRTVRGTSYGALHELAAGGIINPRENVVRACARAVGVDEEWLLTGGGYRTREEGEIAAAVESGDAEAFGRWLRRRGTGDQLFGEMASSGVLGALLEYDDEALRFSLSRVFRKFCAAIPPTERFEGSDLLLFEITLRGLLGGPLGLWGFRHDLRSDPERWESYLSAMTTALLLALPDVGQGDPMEERGTTRPAYLHPSPHGRETTEGWSWWTGSDWVDVAERPGPSELPAEMRAALQKLKAATPAADQEDPGA